MLDNLGRDMRRMMWLLVVSGVLAGAAAASVIIWVVQRLAR